MRFFDKLVGGENKVRESVKAATTSGIISYDAKLVDKLKEDHQELIRLYTAIKQSAADGRFNELPDLLSDFKMLLQNHFALENVRFYVYVQQRWIHDAETSEFIAELRKEMNNIARAVMKFVETYIAAQPTYDTVATFNAELDQIGAALTKRVQLEESHLYSLYQPA